ncbi:hypothetical protein [Clostridium botulinum]|uniref:hypothetical protein n=1 Tax=Clostridium botulinum TaxID=1491 RepID=UPI00035BA863|nr:hypothetical protein [Clostridium botulinum]APH21828.1 hypothetical protein NPD1_2886 [Clostridium botulinum]APQ69990.1 hypothetical protein RSJ8_1012 [Clostridium botulinum]AUN06644.1 hypothetical protein RSJ14_07965 [Clostridium botulinum]EPS56466.1 hypothetical protein CLQ_02071 [Clostridium botulinum Af84]MBN3351415.1 hypothetical protein [Clostridium botulinum]
MYIYEYMTYEGHPYQSAIVVADNKEEALEIVLKEVDRDCKWVLEGEHELKKGLITYGDADC